MMRNIAFLFLLAVNMGGCNSSVPDFEDYSRCIQSGLRNIQWAREMNEVFPQCDHFIVHYGVGRELEKEWQSEAYFGGRFAITMSVVVRMNSARNAIIEVVDEPVFYIREFTEIVPTGSGGYSVKVGKQFRFGLEEWQRFTESKSVEIFDDEWTEKKEVANFNDLARSVKEQRVSW